MTSKIYIIRIKKPKVAHILDGKDTACKLASTGGLNIENYHQSKHTMKPVCHMCSVNWDKKQNEKKEIKKPPILPLTQEVKNGIDHIKAVLYPQCLGNVDLQNLCSLVIGRYYDQPDFHIDRIRDINEARKVYKLAVEMVRTNSKCLQKPKNV